MNNLKSYRLLCSVGENGNNLPYDVRAVQLVWRSLINLD